MGRCVKMIKNMIETIILSITSFVGTNIDDIFINTLFFSEAKNQSEIKGIVIGKYLGTSALILLSVLSALGLRFLPQHYIGYLGLVPIGLGVKEIIANIKSKETEGIHIKIKKTANMMLNTALITMANGADNIGVYIPLFTGFTVWQIVLVLCVFLVLIAVWCFLGKMLADLPVLKNILTRYRTIIVPVVYIALGVYILLKNFL